MPPHPETFAFVYEASKYQRGDLNLVSNFQSHRCIDLTWIFAKTELLGTWKSVDSNLTAHSANEENKGKNAGEFGKYAIFGSDISF